MFNTFVVRIAIDSAWTQLGQHMFAVFPLSDVFNRGKEIVTDCDTHSTFRTDQYTRVYVFTYASLRKTPFVPLCWCAQASSASIGLHRVCQCVCVCVWVGSLYVFLWIAVLDESCAVGRFAQCFQAARSTAAELMAHFTSADLAEIERQCRVAVDLTDAQQAALLRLTNIRDPRMLSVDEARELVFCITSMTDSSGQIAVIHALRDLAAREVFQGAPRRHGRDHYAEMVRIVVDIPHIIVPMSELMCDLAMLRVSRTRMIAAGTHEACASMIHTSEPREPVVPALTVLTRLFVHSRNDRDDYTALARLNLFRAFENVFDTGREEEPQPRALRVALAQASLFAVHRRRVAVANERLLTAWTRLLSAMIVHDDALRIHDHERNALLFATQNLFRFARERDVPAILTAIRRWVEVETPGILAWCLEAELLDRIVERFQLRLPLEREQPSSQERRDIQEQSLRLVNSILRFLDQYQGDQMYRNLFLNLLKAQNIQACYMNGESDLADFYSVLASNLARYP